MTLEEFFEKDQEEVKALFKQWDDNKPQPPLFLDMEDYLNFAVRVKNTLEVINETTNPRLVVLETWLIIDYIVRRLLVYGLELDRFVDKDFTIISQSFSVCLSQLKDLKKNQEKKPPHPHRYQIILPSGFVDLMVKDKEFFRQYLRYEKEYYRSVYSNFDKIKNLAFIQHKTSEYRNVSDFWFHQLSKLNNQWFKSAEQLNNLRNGAAHAFHLDELYRKLEITGDDKLNLLKAHCKKLFITIVGLKD